MKNVILIIILLVFANCKNHENENFPIKIEELPTVNTFEIKLTKDSITREYLKFADTLNHFKNIPLPSAKGSKPSIANDLYKIKDLPLIPLNESYSVSNRYSILVTNLLFIPTKIIAGAQYSSEKAEYIIQDFYYPSKEITQQVLLNIENQINKKENHFESFVGYFKPCGHYIFAKDKKLTIIQVEYTQCSKIDLIEKYVNKNKDDYDVILYLQPTYDNQSNEELVTLSVLKN